MMYETISLLIFIHANDVNFKNYLDAKNINVYSMNIKFYIKKVICDI